MKIAKWLVGVVAVLLGGVYIVAFTSLGNGIVAPIVEKKMQQNLHLNAQLQTFSLSTSEIKIVLALTPKNTLSIQGSYSPFSQSVDLSYDLTFSDLKELQPLTQTQLQGALLTDGKIKGDMKFLTVDGKSDLAHSDTTYHVELTDLNPTSIVAKLHHIDLQTLLAMIGQKRYATATIDIDANFKNITPHQLDGDVLLQTSKGALNPKVMKEDFNISIPSTSFAMNLSAQLKGDDITYKYLLKSNLAKISSRGNITPQPLHVSLKYGLDIQELAVFKPMTGTDLRGGFKLSGTAKGDKQKMVIDAKSDIAASLTTAHITLKAFQPSEVTAQVRHLKVQKLLYMIKQPHYTDANIDVDAKLTNLDPQNLQGEVVTKIMNGKLDSNYLTRAYKFKHPMPTTTYNGIINTVLNKGAITSQIDFNSNLANLDIEKARYVLADASLTSDYKVKVPNLDRLYFVSDRHLRGGITAHGKITKAKDLDLTMLSDIANGKLDAKLHNDDFTAHLNDMDTLKVLNILLYPEVFDAKVDADVKYNLATSKGVVDAKLKEGKFTKNAALDLTKQYAKIDLYKQIFSGIANAKVNKEHVNASLDLKSNASSISTKNTKLNTKTHSINSKIKIVANNNPAIYVTLQGDLNRPKVNVDVNAIIKHEAQKVINKEVNKFLRKLF